MTRSRTAATDTRPKRRERRPPSAAAGCCRVAGLVTVDERGQMVLPKSVRERAAIRAGDQLALVSWEQGDDIHGVFLIKADHLTDLISAMLEPALGRLGKEPRR
ncbi:MAG: AbrB/MazE/SpoVT family DNA-binding domain-containing protein [Acidobacteria bacterium]|nr:AbrB/MazE/SpoVT family DNA-binding domain-containing protein [Acidobacteriota bacterium]